MRLGDARAVHRSKSTVGIVLIQKPLRILPITSFRLLTIESMLR